MYELNPERNIENMPPIDHKTALHLKFENKITGDFFQTDNQPTVGTNVTSNHNIRQHDSLYILVE